MDSGGSSNGCINVCLCRKWQPNSVEQMVMERHKTPYTKSFQYIRCKVKTVSRWSKFATGQWWGWGHRRSVDLTQDQCHLSSSPLHSGNRGAGQSLAHQHQHCKHIFSTCRIIWWLDPASLHMLHHISSVGDIRYQGALFWQCRGAFWPNLWKFILKTFSWC